VRAPGPQGHRSAVYPTAAIPPELHPVLTGSRPWKRLTAFVHLRDHPTLRATAAALRIDPKVLARYIQQLERELGQQLVHRSAAPHPITEHGLALANTIATTLEQTPSLARTEITRLPIGRSRR
jgi:DNA-binding transcriptional LysR family regulator